MLDAVAAAHAILEISDLRFAYPNADDTFRIAIDALEIPRGEHTAFIGPSGCGKTTLLRLLTGVIVPQTGSVRLGSTELTRAGAARRRLLRISEVGMVFQHFALLEYLTALDNILLPYRVSALRLDAAVRDRALALARSTGIESVLRRRPARLSQGECQRVAICRALVTRPALLVCDEPTGNLDPDRSVATVDLLVREANDSGATLVMVTHDHALLDRFDRVVDLRDLVGRDGAA